MIEQFEAHDDGITEEALIGLLGSAFDEGRRGRATSAVLARGRQLRRRKRTAPALAALGVIAAAAGLSLTLTGPSAGHTVTADGAAVNVDEASFSVHTNARTGAVTVTILEYFHEDELKQILAEAGIRAVFNPPCEGPGIKDLNPYNGVITNDVGHSVTIDPSKMPSGSVLDFSFTPGPYEPYNGMGVGLLSGEPTGACAPR